MTHLELIVQAMYTKLAALPGLYVMRLRPFEEDELPASNVLIEEVSPIETRVIGPQDWQLQFSVVSIVAGDAPFAELEGRRSVIHTALLPDTSWGGLIVDITANGFKNEPDPELPLVRLWQHFTLQYRNSTPLEP
ncbi:hypothetical protein [Deefgea rivuli]|uniref:hypothetical protein n=1 Tax=Deefgea rivuli TaxID=400948 RepID=UPI00047FC6C7|nr:hypothetical protein [Deefgea rivuli]